ncbi:ABC transporter permease [Achromobacter pestifer]|uniref:ABC transporter permease n=1 Tax=Achromobacter pestifer TaxID=1353889 RepID=A0A7D4I236_9BURK|nr:ABC transporter permease [Achromobacter pestifer]QKH37236.1 ABC transporter permease [Achromobacter pestifer]
MSIRPSWWFAAAALIAGLVLAYLFLPALVVVPVSFTDRSYLSFPAESWSLQHYRQLVESPVWRDSLLQSVAVSAVSTLAATALGCAAAIGAWKLGARLGGLVRMLALLPLIVPTIVGALAYYRLYIDLGLLDTYTGVVLAHVVAATPFVFVSVGSALANFDPRLEQAARSMGASPLQVLRRVTLPGIRPGIVSGAIFAFIVSWDELVVLLFITTRNVYLLPRAMWDGINENVDPTIAAVATLMILITFICLCVERLLAHRKGKREST